MNNDMFSLLGGFDDFGCLFAVQCCRVGIGKETAYRKIEELLIKQKNREVVQVQPGAFWRKNRRRKHASKPNFRE